MRWFELPVEARRYILYHALASPVLITWYALPFYLMKVGYGVLEVGALFTAADLLSVPVTVLLGRGFRRVDLRLGLAAIDLMEAVSLALFSMAYGPLAPLLVLAGQLVDEASSVLYFLYPAYERIVYPEERFKEAMLWHMAVPELSVVLTYPALGYVLGRVCGSPSCLRRTFAAFAVYQLLLIPYILLALRPVVIEGERGGQGQGRGEGEWGRRELWRRYGIYVVADVLFVLGWSLAPSLAMVYLVMERFGGDMLHVALVEASISLASLASLPLADRIPSRSSFRALQGATIVTTAGLLGVILSNSFPALILSVWVVRFGDALAFVFRRTWLFGIMGRWEASTVSAALSSLRRALGIVSPLLAGTLATLDPRAPYAACLALLAATIPVYGVAALRAEMVRGIVRVKLSLYSE